MNLNLDISSCVRYYSKSASCNLCEEICPTEAIKVKELALDIFQDKCIACGGCVGVCPNEALSLVGLNVAEFFFEFLKSEEEAISCKKNFVCLAALNVEYLISFGLIKSIVLDLGHCDECNISNSCLPQIKKNIKEANKVLDAICTNRIIEKKLYLQKDKDENRREFLNIFSLKEAIKIKDRFDKSVEALENPTKKITLDEARSIKQKKIPQKRKLFFTVIKRHKKPKEYLLFEPEEISFVSSKSIDESCDNCSICYRLCPTSALSTNSKNSVIYFDDMLCIKCKLCHDVCERDSIKLINFSTKEFFEPTQKELISFDITRCDECGNFFTYQGGEKICRRCKIEEEEAKSLWGIS